MRTAIPVELKRTILVEAGHRCAIPTCRATNVEIAHIKPWNQVKKHEYENLIALCPNCHTRFDKGEIDTKSMKRYKAQLRFAIEKYSKFELDVLEALYVAPPNNAMPFIKHLLLLVKSVLDDGLIRLHETASGVLIGGVKANPDYIVITDKGRKYMEDFRENKATTYGEIKES